MKRIDAIKSMFLAPFAIGAGKALANKGKIREKGYEKENLSLFACDPFDLNHFKTVEGAMISLMLHINGNHLVLFKPEFMVEEVEKLMKKYFSHIEHQVHYFKDEDRSHIQIWFKGQDRKDPEGFSIVDFWIERTDEVFNKLKKS